MASFAKLLVKTFSSCFDVNCFLASFVLKALKDLDTQGYEKLLVKIRNCCKQTINIIKFYFKLWNTLHIQILYTLNISMIMPHFLRLMFVGIGIIKGYISLRCSRTHFIVVLRRWMNCKNTGNKNRNKNLLRQTFQDDERLKVFFVSKGNYKKLKMKWMTTYNHFRLFTPLRNLYQAIKTQNTEMKSFLYQGADK